MGRLIDIDAVDAIPGAQVRGSAASGDRNDSQRIRSGNEGGCRDAERVCDIVATVGAYGERAGAGLAGG